MASSPISCPFGEAYLRHQFGNDPIGARRSCGSYFGAPRCVDRQLIQPVSQIAQHGAGDPVQTRPA